MIVRSMERERRQWDESAWIVVDRCDLGHERNGGRCVEGPGKRYGNACGDTDDSSFTRVYHIAATPEEQGLAKRMLESEARQKLQYAALWMHFVAPLGVARTSRCSPSIFDREVGFQTPGKNR